MKRYWEIDALRGTAVVAMIGYHFFWDLQFLDLMEVEIGSGLWRWLAMSIGFTFLFVVGTSLALSHYRVRDSYSCQQKVKKYGVRGLKLIALGVVISLVTWAVIGEGFIFFGILHCIGLSVMLSVPFLKLEGGNLLLGATVIVLGVVVGDIVLGHPWLSWLGFTFHGMYTIDYYPLIPWFGAVLLGVGVGNILYSKKGRKFSLEDLSSFGPVKSLARLGRTSLLIYLLHQPVMLGLLYGVMLTL